ISGCLKKTPQGNSLPISPACYHCVTHFPFKLRNGLALCCPEHCSNLREMSSDEDSQPLHRLPFPPITKSHILNCSFHSWYPKYVLLSSHLLSNVSRLRSVTPNARLIPLSDAFLEYLR